MCFLSFIIISIFIPIYRSRDSYALHRFKSRDRQYDLLHGDASVLEGILVICRKLIEIILVNEIVLIYREDISGR